MKKLPSLALCALLFAACAPAQDPVIPPKPPGSAPSTTAARAAPPEPPALRLPDIATPTRYDVDLTLDPNEKSFTGTIRISLDVKKETGVIWLHAEGIRVKKATMTIGGQERAVEVTTAPPFLGILPQAPLAQGEPAVLRIDYEAAIDTERPQGVYSAPEGKDNKERYLYTIFEPLEARRAFPCFDEPSYKVPWKMTLRVPKGMSGFSNAEIVKDSEEGGMRKLEMADTPPLPSYLVAFMAGPFDVVDAGTVGNDKKKLRFIVPRGRGAETRYATEVTPKLIFELEKYLGINYPYSKLDIAVVPRYEGTMEHPGLVALGQPLTLIEPGAEPLARKRSYATIGAHELAHIWFGDLVTMKWWDDTWLNESFAQWMDAKVTDAVEPSWGVLQSERLGRSATAMQADSEAAAKRMRQPVVKVEDIYNAFDAGLTYAKGASVITMLEHAAGPGKWQSAVQRYLTKHAWGSTSADDFIAVLSEDLGKDAAQSFESFLNQPGVPLVTVRTSCGAAGNKLVLSQKRFSPVGADLPKGVWSVPVCVRYGAGAESGRTCAFISSETKEVAISDVKTCPAWVVPNEDGAGYYVSAYTDASLDTLMGKRKPEILSIAERATLVRDVGLLVSSGDVPLGKALSLLPDTVATGEKTALLAAFSIFQNVRVADLPEPLHKKLQSFAQKTFSTKAKALGLSPKPNEPAGNHEVRELVLYSAGISGEDQELIATAKKLVTKFLSDKTALVPDVRRVALALAMHSNDAALFDKLAERGKEAKDRSEKQLYFFALAMVTDKALAEKTLDLVLSQPLEMRDVIGVVEILLSGRKTRDLTYAWLKKSFDKLLERASNFEKPYLFGMARVYCDAAHRADAEAFFGPRAKGVDGAARILAGSLEAITVCEAAQQAALPSLSAFLKKY